MHILYIVFIEEGVIMFRENSEFYHEFYHEMSNKCHGRLGLRCGGGGRAGGAVLAVFKILQNSYSVLQPSAK